MLTVGKRIPGGSGLAAAVLRRAAVVALDWDVRQKSRFEAVDDHGRRIAVFLPRGTAVRGGDVLVAEDGSLVRVEPAAQPVLVVRARPDGGTHFDLARAAYHLGNRHVALELAPDHLKLEPDHVLADMLRRMGLVVDEARAPFEPEAGAYAGHAHGQDRSHDHAQDHAHGHAHEHAQGHAPPSAHEHSPERGEPVDAHRHDAD